MKIEFDINKGTSIFEDGEGNKINSPFTDVSIGVFTEQIPMIRHSIRANAHLDDGGIMEAKKQLCDWLAAKMGDAEYLAKREKERIETGELT